MLRASRGARALATLFIISVRAALLQQLSCHTFKDFQYPLYENVEVSEGCSSGLHYLPEYPPDPQ